MNEPAGSSRAMEQQTQTRMKGKKHSVAAAVLVGALCCVGAASAQKHAAS